MELVLKAMFGQRFLNQKHIAQVILSKENLQGFVHHSASGSEKKKTKPTPSSLSAHIRPP